MSVEVTVWAWEQDLQPHQKLVLLAIADGGDPGGDGPPPSLAASPASLAKRCSMQEPVVIDTVNQLVELGLVVIDPHGKWNRVTR